VVVRDDEDAVADPGPPGGGREVVVARQRMAALAFDRQIG
jgi:hypothetical protein